METLQRLKPDVLVSDIQLADEDGYALIRKVRALGAERGGQVRAAALTAYARSEDRARALRAGFQAHVAKPVDVNEVVSVVAKLAESGPGDEPNRRETTSAQGGERGGVGSGLINVTPTRRLRARPRAVSFVATGRS